MHHESTAVYTGSYGVGYLPPKLGNTYEVGYLQEILSSHGIHGRGESRGGGTIPDKNISFSRDGHEPAGNDNGATGTDGQPLVEVSRENGAMKFLPGSHHRGILDLAAI